jgi:hypothetical protein
MEQKMTKNAVMAVAVALGLVAGAAGGMAYTSQTVTPGTGTMEAAGIAKEESLAEHRMRTGDETEKVPAVPEILDDGQAEDEAAEESSGKYDNASELWEAFASGDHDAYRMGGAVSLVISTSFMDVPLHADVDGEATAGGSSFTYNFGSDGSVELVAAASDDGSEELSYRRSIIPSMLGQVDGSAKQERAMGRLLSSEAIRAVMTDATFADNGDSYTIALDTGACSAVTGELLSAYPSALLDVPGFSLPQVLASMLSGAIEISFDRDAHMTGITGSASFAGDGLVSGLEVSIDVSFSR